MMPLCCSRISFLSFSQGAFGVIVGILFFVLALFNFFLIYRVRGWYRLVSGRSTEI